jgi:endonuclease YncB( thermonuclease family)
MRLLPLFLFLLLLGLAPLPALAEVRIGQELHGPVRVSDGDSLRMGDLRIRLLGIDAPELDQTCLDGSTLVPCGEWARDVLADLIEGEAVSCLVMDIDRFGRAVAECVGASGSLNGEMAASGWAIATPRFSTRFVQDAANAANAGLGLWAMRFHDPFDWRQGVRW